MAWCQRRFPATLAAIWSSRAIAEPWSPGQAQPGRGGQESQGRLDSLDWVLGGVIVREAESRTSQLVRSMRVLITDRLIRPTISSG